jgi:hypothetical protein
MGLRSVQPAKAIMHTAALEILSVVINVMVVIPLG